MHDGSTVLLRKLEEDYDPTNTIQAISRLHEATQAGQMLTGLIFLTPEKKSFTELLNLVDQPLYSLTADVTKPSREALDAIMQELM
jgi:2-oxoglutarate ferredoxin oxidoreductase subunit beta